MLGWWRRRGHAARFDVHVRISLYVNFAAVPILAGVGLAPDLGTAAWVVAALAAVPALAGLLLLHAGLDHYLGKKPRPTRLIVATAAFTVAGAVAGYLAYPDPTPGHRDGPATAILLILVASFVTGLSTAVRPRVTAAVAAAGVAATYALAVAQGTADSAAGPTLAFALLLTTLVVAYRVTAWMLGLVWELDRSRQVQASLAVAEERLRFARDLHDVVGRTLSVVALKAELAAQLAKRGRDDAVDEMLEVRRIAQDSLAELRAVVGGYRSADLDVELAGARSLLASAGIECRVIGDGSGLPAPVQGTLGWVVREGTTNVLRHSEARGCTVTLRPSSGGTVTLTMDNDGVAGGAAAGESACASAVDSSACPNGSRPSAVRSPPSAGAPTGSASPSSCR